MIVEGFQDGESAEGPQEAYYQFQTIVFPERLNSTLISSETTVADIVQTMNIEDLPQGDAPIICPLFHRAGKDRVGSRSYSPTASTYIDIFLRKQRGVGRDNLQVFRLIVASRTCASPIKGEIGLLYGRFPEKTEEVPLAHGGEPLVDRGVHQLAPRHAPKALSNLLVPTSGIEGYCGALTHDDRSIIYLTGCPKRDDKEKFRIVLMNFDPWIGFPSLETMKLRSLSDHSFVMNESQLDSSEMTWYKDLTRVKESRRELS